MKQLLHKKSILFIAVMSILCFGMHATAMAHGGGGDGSQASTSPAPTPVNALGSPEMNQINMLMGTKSRGSSGDGSQAAGQTAKKLAAIQQAILGGDTKGANDQASVIKGLTTTAQSVGKAGKLSGSGLSFVPRVGWVTSGVPGIGILPDATISAVNSVSVNELSPLGADTSFNNAKTAWNADTNGADKKIGKIVTLFTENIARFGGTEEIEQGAADALKTALANAMKKASNRAVMPNYINSP